MVLEKTLESPLDGKEIQPVHPKGDQSWVFFGRTDAEAETPILWPPDAKNWLFGKDPDAGQDWGQEEKGTTEDEMVGWHHRLDGRESEQAPGVGDGQGSPACCSLWRHKEPDVTERLNWTEVYSRYLAFRHCFWLWVVFSRASFQLPHCFVASYQTAWKTSVFRLPSSRLVQICPIGRATSSLYDQREKSSRRSLSSDTLFIAFGHVHVRIYLNA